MFNIFKKKKEEIIEVNEFGDNNYQMKDIYEANSLVVANFSRFSSDVTKWGPMVETTLQKYIFEPIVIGDKLKYREIFTGFIASDEEEYFMLPFLVNPEPLTNYIPEAKDKRLPKLSLIWTLNDINHPKCNNKVKSKKIR